MRSKKYTVFGIGALGLVLSTTLAFIGAADDVRDVQVGNKSFQARTVNGRTILTKGIDTLTVRSTEDDGTNVEQEARKRSDRAIVQRRASRKDTAIKLKEEYERLTREGKHEAAAKVKQDLTLNSLQGHAENFEAFIEEHFENNERLLVRIDTLEKRIKELEEKRD